MSSGVKKIIIGILLTVLAVIVMGVAYVSFIGFMFFDAIFVDHDSAEQIKPTAVEQQLHFNYDGPAMFTQDCGICGMNDTKKFEPNVLRLLDCVAGSDGYIYLSNPEHPILLASIPATTTFAIDHYLKIKRGFSFSSGSHTDEYTVLNDSIGNQYVYNGALKVGSVLKCANILDPVYEKLKTENTMKVFIQPGPMYRMNELTDLLATSSRYYNINKIAEENGMGVAFVDEAAFDYLYGLGVFRGQTSDQILSGGTVSVASPIPRYQNNAYGISFEYPNNLHVLESEKDGNHLIVIGPYANNDRKQRSELEVTDTIKVIIHDENKSFEEIVDTATKSVGEGVKKSREVVGGVDAVHLSYISSFAGEEHNSIYIPCRTTVSYGVEISYVAPLREEYSQIIKSINVCKKRP